MTAYPKQSESLIKLRTFSIRLRKPAKRPTMKPPTHFKRKTTRRHMQNSLLKRRDKSTLILLRWRRQRKTPKRSPKPWPMYDQRPKAMPPRLVDSGLRSKRRSGSFRTYSQKPTRLRTQFYRRELKLKPPRRRFKVFANWGRMKVRR